MKIAAFGATGNSGRHMLAAALADGHAVSVLVRNPSKLPPGKYGLTIHLGDVTDADSVDDTVFGQEVVVSTLGLPAQGRTDILSQGMARIIQAMTAHRLRRLVVVAGAGILADSKTGSLRMQSPAYPEQYRVYAQEHLRVWRQLEASALDWTLVCPLTMRDEEDAVPLRTAIDQLPAGGKTATFAGVGRFAYHLLGSSDFLRQRVGVAE